MKKNKYAYKNYITIEGVVYKPCSVCRELVPLDKYRPQGCKCPACCREYSLLTKVLKHPEMAPELIQQMAETISILSRIDYTKTATENLHIMKGKS